MNLEGGDNYEFENQLRGKIDTGLFIDKLPPRQKEVVELRIGGYRFREIANLLDIATSTAYTHMKLARQKFKIWMN